MNRANPGMAGHCAPFRAGPGPTLTWVNPAGAAGPYRRAVMDLPRLFPADWRRLQDDVQGLVTGTLFVALGIFLMKSAGLVPGGLVGLALLVHYGTGVDLGAILFLVNLPFYLLAWTRMGRAFTLRTAIAVSLLSLLTWWLPQAVALQQIDGALAAVLGGLLCGAGMLIIFRHGASLGGLNVLVLRLQDRLGWPAGKTQMVLDALIVLGGAWYVGDARKLALSILAVVALNLALVYNHRPGRYQPV